MQTKTVEPGIEIIRLPSGSHLIGTDDRGVPTNEIPSVRINLEYEVWLMARPMTRHEWSLTGLADPSRHGGSEIMAGLHPVDSVTIPDIEQALEILNADMDRGAWRLPTEAEWEIACRAGTGTSWWFGDDGGELGRASWYSANAGVSTCVVGQKEPNPWGFHDMLGNVREWCSDVWLPSHDERPRDGSPAEGDDPRRPARGGAWMCEGLSCRASSRVALNPESRSDAVGLRLAWSPGMILS